MIGRRALAIVVIMITVACLVQAEMEWTYTPDPINMYNLDHGQVYGWGIDATEIDPMEHVIAAELTFYNIRNWNDQSNILYIHQLNWPNKTAPGLYNINDPDSGESDFFATDFTGAHTHLVTYEDLSDEGQELTYEFTSDDLIVLNYYLSDGLMGIGVDPDCHFWNDGVELKLITSAVPTPASIGLGLLGLGGLVLLRRQW